MDFALSSLLAVAAVQSKRPFVEFVVHTPLRITTMMIGKIPNPPPVI